MWRGWYANQVSNEDPMMLGLCPLHLTPIEQTGQTTVLFNRPSFCCAAEHSAKSDYRKLELYKGDKVSLKLSTKVKTCYSKNMQQTTAYSGAGIAIKITIGLI
ncbi:MAG: hypothetical protein Q9M92_05155 [Enterobacterales bacterium]|nr:hypothetical protein [Enterobacterales bacterium]